MYIVSSDAFSRVMVELDVLLTCKVNVGWPNMAFEWVPWSCRKGVWFVYSMYIHNIHNLTYVDISAISYHVVQNNHASIWQYISLPILMNILWLNWTVSLNEAEILWTFACGPGLNLVGSYCMWQQVSFSQRWRGIYRMILKPYWFLLLTNFHEATENKRWKVWPKYIRFEHQRFYEIFEISAKNGLNLSHTSPLLQWVIPTIVWDLKHDIPNSIILKITITQMKLIIYSNKIAIAIAS